MFILGESSLEAPGMASGLGTQLKSRWLAQGVSIRPGVTAKQIQSFEAHHGVVLPDDLREYLETVDGTGRGSDWDADLFCFWSLDELTPLTQEHPDAKYFEELCAYFLFADYSIECPAYAIRLSNDRSAETPILAIFSDRREYSSYPVADSFSEFVEEYFTHGVVD
jgi:hypothetical protein